MIADSRTRADTRSASGACQLVALTGSSGLARDTAAASIAQPERTGTIRPAATPRPDTARDGQQPWLGHGPPIPGANMRDVLAVLDRVSDVCGPEGNPRALPIVDFPSAEAALTAASQRVTQALWEDRQDAPLAWGSAGMIDLLLELKETQGRLREARLAQRIDLRERAGCTRAAPWDHLRLANDRPDSGRGMPSRLRPGHDLAGPRVPVGSGGCPCRG